MIRTMFVDIWKYDELSVKRRVKVYPNVSGKYDVGECVIIGRYDSLNNEYLVEKNNALWRIVDIKNASKRGVVMPILRYELIAISSMEHNKERRKLND